MSKDRKKKKQKEDDNNFNLIIGYVDAYFRDKIEDILQDAMSRFFALVDEEVSAGQSLTRSNLLCLTAEMVETIRKTMAKPLCGHAMPIISSAKSFINDLYPPEANLLPLNIRKKPKSDSPKKKRKN